MSEEESDRDQPITSGINLRAAWRLKPQLYKHAPACAGYKASDFTLVRRTFGALTRNGGLRFYSREFHSPGLKLTPMDNIVPLRCGVRNLLHQCRFSRFLISSCAGLAFVLNLNS
jgi:hypothetical protein